MRKFLVLTIALLLTACAHIAAPSDTGEPTDEQVSESVILEVSGTAEEKVSEYLRRAEEAKEELREKLELESEPTSWLPNFEIFPTAHAQDDEDGTIEELLTEIEANL